MGKQAYTDEERELHNKERHAILEAAIESLTTEAGFARWLSVRTRASLRRFSFSNQMMIIMQRPDAQLVRTFSGWQAEGRQVRKGEKGIWVLKPVFRKVQLPDPDDPTKTIERQEMVGFTGLKEFDISQTDGEPIDIPEYVLGTDKLGGYIDKLTAYADTLGYAVTIGGEPPRLVDPNCNGYCDTQDKTIWVRNGTRAIDDQVRTLIHEIAHAHDIDYAKFERPDAETIVETVAAIILIQLGIDDIKASASYIANWTLGDMAMVKARAAMADKVAAKIEKALDLGMVA